MIKRKLLKNKIVNKIKKIVEEYEKFYNSTTFLKKFTYCVLLNFNEPVKSIKK